MNSDAPDRTGLDFLPTLSSSLSQQLPEELRLDVPYIHADEPHLSGAAVAQMLARFHELDVRWTQSQIADTAGWALTDYDHSTFREKLDRILANAGLLVSSYYPAAHVARAVGNGLEATRIIRRNYPAFQERDYEFFRALLSEAKSPLVARVHFTTAHYPMSEEMAEKLDMSGHCVLIVGYDRTGFIIHDPWRVDEWGGYMVVHIGTYPSNTSRYTRSSMPQLIVQL